MKRTWILGGALLLALFFLIAHQFGIVPPAGQRRAAESPGLLSNQLSIDDSQTLASMPENVREVVPLIISGEKNDAEWTRRTPAAKRVRKIIPDPSLMTAEPVLGQGDVVELALFEDMVISAEISKVLRYSNGAVGMTAQLQGDKKGVAFISYSGGELRASVEIDGADDYSIRYDSKTQSHYAIQVDRKESDYLEGGDSPGPMADEMVRDAPPAVSESGEPIAVGDIPAGLPEGTVEVDVMIVYTPAALSYEGGIAGMNNNIAQALLKANEALANSDALVYLNLVHSAEVDYTEDASALNDLYALTNMDGVIDEVHSLRDTYGADLVCLFEYTNSTGGLGWLLNNVNGSPTYAFCLARIQQSDWTYTVVHEWGHNMGCAHSASQTSHTGDNGLYSYSSGWQWDDSASSGSIGYCSVMTYENFDGLAGDEYKRVAHFANPDIDYTGNSVNSTGDATDGDNALTIRNVRYVLADYRISQSVPPPVEENPFPVISSFEQEYAPWIHDAGVGIWTRNSGGTSSPDTGPSTGADGNFYVYTESKDYPGQTALLQATFDFRDAPYPDIDFSYHMYGSAMGSLYLEVSSNSGSTWDALWSESGDQGDQWFSTNVSLSAYAGLSNVQIRFRGEIGSKIRGKFRSDMALDMIVVSAGSTDIDNDGLPNEWELLYFGTETNANPAATSSNGINTVLEAYIAGLDPTDPAASFLVSGLNPSSSENILQWEAVSGRVYSVYWSTNLQNGFDVMPLASNITDGVFTDTVHGAENSVFYRLEIYLAP